MSETKKKKFNRLNKIKSYLSQNPAHQNKILEFINSKEDIVSLRTLQNYLEELKSIGVIALNDNGFYELKEVKIPNYDDEYSHKLMLEHSKHLVLEYQGDEVPLKNFSSPFAVDCIVYHDSRAYNDSRHVLGSVYQHIQTGYPDVFSLIKRYRDLMDKNGFSARPNFPKLVGGDGINSSEILDLREQIANKLQLIIFRVENGKVIKGYCDSCPGK